MNNLVFGFVSIFAILFASLEGSLQSYVQLHSFILVVGGTAAVLVFSTPGPVIGSLYKTFIALFKKEETIKMYQPDLMALAQSRSASVTTSHRLITYAQELWNQGIDPDLFIVLISECKREQEQKMTDAVQAIKNLAKYPPTLGMTGTVMGMISLFSSLDGNKNNIGQALSTAMTATFLGLVLSNLFLAPLADRMHVKQVHKHRMLDNIYEILLLINQGEPIILIREELNERAA
jgi:chemotaxis protein MotA